MSTAIELINLYKQGIIDKDALNTALKSLPPAAPGGERPTPAPRTRRQNENSRTKNSSISR